MNVREMHKNGEYYTIIYEDNKRMYGALILPTEEMYVEFLEFGDNDHINIITEEQERFNELKDKYLDRLLELLKN
jgi:hypothetical protein